VLKTTRQLLGSYSVLSATSYYTLCHVVRQHLLHFLRVAPLALHSASIARYLERTSTANSTQSWLLDIPKLLIVHHSCCCCCYHYLHFCLIDLCFQSYWYSELSCSTKGLNLWDSQSIFYGLAAVALTHSTNLLTLVEFYLSIYQCIACQPAPILQLSPHQTTFRHKNYIFLVLISLKLSLLILQLYYCFISNGLVRHVPRHGHFCWCDRIWHFHQSLEYYYF